MAGKSTLLVAVLAGALLSGSAGAFDVQLDVGYAITDVEILPGDDNIKTTVVGATYYFGGILNDRNPYDLQSFFQRAPYGQVLYTNPDYGFWERRVLDVNAELFMAPPAGGLSFRPHILNDDMDPGGSISIWALDVGLYVLDELKVTLPGAVTGYLDENDGDLVDSALSAKRVIVEYVARTGRENIYMAVDCTWNTDSEVTFLSVGATYYPSKGLGVGLTLGNNQNGVDNVAVDFGYWPSSQVRLGGGVTFHTDNSFIGEASTLGFSLAARF